MDAVELVLPESVITMSKLMGSGGFAGGDGSGDARAAIGTVKTGQSEANSLMILSSVDVCSQRAKIPPASASEFKIPDSRRFVTNNQPSSCHGGDAYKDLKKSDLKASQSLIPDPEAKHLHQRFGKVERSNSGSLRRSRIVRSEFSKNESGVEDIKGNSSGFGSGLTKCITADKAQMTKQRNNLNVKRSDKRAPRSRSDSFCLKNGWASFSSVAGVGNFVVYGSKSDVFDITKPVDELPLNELLDGSFKRPSLIRDKGKAVQDLDENLLNSVRKACSILQLENPVPVQNSVEIDNDYHPKDSTSPYNTSASRMDDSCAVNEYKNKDSFGDAKSPAFAINSSLFAPKDVLDRLALPPSKELDSLLLDAVKPASSSRSGTELRIGKTVSNRNGLPPFTWSQNSSGHVKSGLDAVKISPSRITCPGRWVKVGNTLTPSEGSNGLPVDLKSLTYDHRLVPIGNPESSPLGGENVSSKCVSISSSEQAVLSKATRSVSPVPADENLFSTSAYSPRVLAAAETLCEMASRSSKRSSQETMKWQKKSQKTIKACKAKSSQKSDILGVVPKASVRPHNLVKVSDGTAPSKKIRLSVDEKRNVSCTNLARKEPLYWSAPRSTRPAPSKPSRHSVPEMKLYNNNNTRKSFMMPPPARVPDRAYKSRQKVRRIGSMNWNHPAGSNLDR